MRDRPHAHRLRPRAAPGPPPGRRFLWEGLARGPGGVPERGPVPVVLGRVMGKAPGGQERPWWSGAGPCGACSVHRGPPGPEGLEASVQDSGAAATGAGTEQGQHPGAGEAGPRSGFAPRWGGPENRRRAPSPPSPPNSSRGRPRTGKPPRWRRPAATSGGAHVTAPRTASRRVTWAAAKMALSRAGARGALWRLGPGPGPAWGLLEPRPPRGALR